MFLKDILSDTDYEMILDNYDYEYLESLDYEIFLTNYKMFKSKKFYFVDELIVKFLDIFMLDTDVIESAIYEIEKKYGDNYVMYIGYNMNILEESIIKIIER